MRTSPTRSWPSTCRPCARPAGWRISAREAGFRASRWPSRCPHAHLALVESVGRKCAFLAAAAAELGLANAEVVNARAEAWPGGIGVHDLVVARALAPLPVLVEYAAPLLEAGGALVAWKGRRDPAEEANGAAAAEALGMSAPEAIPVEPFARARERHLYLTSKVSPTPARYPRRPGMARKRPIQASS